jgi:serine phosphatase RsbU (regulator of sigma subunit)/uncharacterized membrane-anchored protein YhcB (DUF1043 family)
LYPQRVFVGLRDGIEIWDYNTTTKQWTVLHNPFPNLHGEVRAIVQDEAGQLWVATKTNGIFRITLQDNLPKSAIKNYTTQQGLWSDKQNKVFSINTSICVGNAKGFVKYNPTKDVFEPHPQLKIDAKELTTQDYWQLAGDNEGNIWAWSQSAKGVFEQKKQYKWNKQLFSRIPQETIQQIFPSGNFVWVGTVNALYRYDKTYQQSHQQGFSVLVRKVSLIPQDSTIAGTYYDANTRTRLHFNNNSLSFDFAATYFDNPAANQYQYMLEGYEQEWSSWTNDTRKDYTNLWNGSYRLKIKAKNIYGELSNERTYHFEILPPWYRTYWAYALYIFAAVSFVILFIRAYTQRLQLQNQKLEELVKLRTAEIQQQKEEIETQRDNLEFLHQETASQKSEIEKSYQNIQVLSQIGTALTRIREVENIITTFYDSVNTLIDAPVFAVGLCNDQRNRLDFYSIENQDSPLEYSFDTLDNPNKLSIWCYRHNQPIYINNIEKEYNLYLEKLQLPETNIPYSIMYVPLRLSETVFGVITVQSFQKNAYTDYQKTIFNNLANYISIALDNAQAYRTIAQKNQQITDSIRYAETIQKAILPTVAEMQSSFGENYFVFYQAKDVVSGNFYWLSNQQTNPQLPANTSFVAAVDCTGHGVPGAFMSLIGATLLNQIIEQKQILSPAKIIGALHADIRKLLRQKDHANRDGMDICLCKLEKQDHTTLLTFAGAKRSLLRVNLENNLEQIKGTYKAVGGGHKEHIDFEETTHQLQVGEMIYLTSDGYTDQNDLHNEKLSSVRLKNLLLSIAQLPIVEQYEHIKTTFLAHKGNETQRDDVTVLGIRIRE